MSWELRLQEMLLAGGALATVACGGATSGSAFDASVTGGDATSDTGIDANDELVVTDFCCNANPDPCCPYEHCDAAPNPTCVQAMACQAEGGTWVINGSGSCSRDAGARDAEFVEGNADAPGDASADAEAPGDAGANGDGSD